MRSKLLASLLLAACGPAPAPAPPATHLADVDPIVARVGADAVTADRYPRRTLYTWTTPEQIDELRRTNQLLARSESPELGASYVDIFVHALAERGDPTAKLLDTTTYAKARFAWASPWPTRLGWPGESYGDALIRVTLRPDAIVLALSSATGTFEARTLDNAIVETPDPAKIAALYFVGDSTRPGAFDIPAPTVTYREYVLCNESMIESWEVGTDDVRATLARDADLVGAIVRYVDAHGDFKLPALPDAWARPATDVAGTVATALALDSPFYRDPRQLAELANVLRGRPGVALSGKPTAGFPGVGPRRPPPRIVPAGASYGRLIRPKRTP